MYDTAKEKQIDDDIQKLEEKETSCCGGKQGIHKGEWVCFCCGMPYDTLKQKLK